jgi:hypothetical protein
MITLEALAVLSFIALYLYVYYSGSHKILSRSFNNCNKSRTFLLIITAFVLIQLLLLKKGYQCTELITTTFSILILVLFIINNDINDYRHNFVAFLIFMLTIAFIYIMMIKEPQLKLISHILIGIILITLMCHKLNIFYALEIMCLVLFGVFIGLVAYLPNTSTHPL